MLENSMKKIEELLHNEMYFKKTIHELKLERDSKSYGQSENILSKNQKKKEKELTDQIRSIELERDSLLSTLTSSREKVKFLENKLNASDQELRKLFEENKNYEELIRNEKDKLVNL